MTSTPLRDTGSLVGQILFIGIDGTSLGPQARDLLARVRPGGIILFKRNAAGLPELARLCADLRAAADPPPILAIDEEGGRVTRLAPHVEGLPPAWWTAAIGGEALREYWRRYGDLLAGLGIDLDFAPVVDLCPPDAPNGIADRSYGTDPAAVVACAGRVIEGLHGAGVLSTLKHFPGLGNTLLDSHHHLPSIRRDRATFEREDLAPFAALSTTCPAVMIGHGHYPFYAGPDPIAATLCRAITTTLLRGTLGFRGAAISDDLEMKAVAARVPWDDLAPRAVEAGNDMVLVCHRADRVVAAHEALLRRADRDASFLARCEEAAGRVAVLRDAGAAARRAAARGTRDAGVADRVAALVEAAAAVPAREA